MFLTKAMVQVLGSIWSGHVTTKSDLTRQHANEVAEAASRGWITTAILRPSRNRYGRQWRMTSTGLMAFERDQGRPKHGTKEADR